MNEYFPVDCEATLQRIGLMVKTARLKQGLRQLDVATRFGVPEKFVRRIEQGDPSVNARSLMLVLWGLGLMESIFRSPYDSPVPYSVLREDVIGRRVRHRKAKPESF